MITCNRIGPKEVLPPAIKIINKCTKAGIHALNLLTMLMREVIVVVDYEYNYTDVVPTGITGQGTRSTRTQLTNDRGNSSFIVN